MRQTIVNTMYLQTYKHTKNTFRQSPLSRVRLLHASTSPTVLSRQIPSISSFADHCCLSSQMVYIGPTYLYIYIYKISYSQFQLLVCVWRSNRFVNILSHFFPQIFFFFHGTEIKHIHVYSYSPCIFKRIILIKTGLTLIDVIKNVFNFEEHNRKIF